MLIDNYDGTIMSPEESSCWGALAVFVVGLFLGVVVTGIFNSLYSSCYYQISREQTRQEIFSLPDGTTWKKIRTAEEVK